MEIMKLLYLLYILALANMQYGITSTTPDISDIDDYDAKATISETILGNSSNTVESAATDYLVQSFDNGADGGEPRKLRKVPKKKSKSKKGRKNRSAKHKAPLSSTSNSVNAKDNKKIEPTPSVEPPIPGPTIPVYARYMASIRDPKHFYVSQVKFDGGPGSEETVYLYFNTPLSESDMKGLLKRSRVEILGSNYEAIKVEDMSKLDALDSKMSWIYDEHDRKFYRFKAAPSTPRNATGDVDKSDETALKEVDHSIPSIDDTAELKTPDSPMNNADADVVGMPHVDEDGRPVPAAENSDASKVTDEGNYSSPETASIASYPTDDSAGNESNDLSTSDEGELPLYDDVAVAPTAATKDNNGGATTEIETATSDVESDKETSENNTPVVSKKVTRKRRKGSKKKNKKNRSTTGSYDLVDKDGNPVDQSQYKETIDDEIASAPLADGVPMMTGYKSLNTEEATDGNSAPTAATKDNNGGATTEIETATSDVESDKETSENNTPVVSKKVTRKRRKGSKKKNKKNRSTTGSYDLVDKDGNPVDQSQYKETIDDEIASAPLADGAPMMTGYKSLNTEEATDGNSAATAATNMLEERNGNIKGDTAKSPRGRGNKRKPAGLWSRRRVQNEVIRTKKKVVNLEKRLGQAEEKIETIVRV